MFAQIFAKQLWSIVYSRYVPLQILNYCETLTRAQDVREPFYSQIADNPRVRCKGGLRLRHCQGGELSPLISTQSPNECGD